VQEWAGPRHVFLFSRQHRRVGCMSLRRIRQPLRLLLVVGAACAINALGCRRAEEIRSYDVPKEATLASAESKPGEATDRMLAAIFPVGEQAWVFKSVGPITEVDRHEKEMNDFFAAITPGTDGRAHWKLPAGWKEEPGNAVRLATIVIPGEKRLEITVNIVPRPNSQESLLANVNRWRGQLQLPEIGADRLKEVAHMTKAGDQEILVVDLKGRYKAGSMAPPFAGGPFTTSGRKPKNSNPGLPDGHPPIDDANTRLPADHPPIGDANSQLPAAHPPIDGQSARDENSAGTAAAPPDVPKFTAPATWKALPAKGLRKADFILTDGKQQAEVTLIEFPANEGPFIADPLLNVNRWRREVGLEEIKKDALAGATESIKIDGQPATFAAMIPDAAKSDQAQTSQASLAAMVRKGEQMWFIKMIGSRELVAARKDEFKAFLKSIKFPRAGGADHGNK
jgi:hypothetical protein